MVDGCWLARDIQTGQMSRDMTLFVDDNGKAYHIFSSEENQTLHVAELTDDYLYHSGKYARILPGGHNEAPAIFKKDGTYWMITSGCTGWAPNAARLSKAQNIFGPWTTVGNPCKVIMPIRHSSLKVRTYCRFTGRIILGYLWRTDGRLIIRSTPAIFGYL